MLGVWLSALERPQEPGDMTADHADKHRFLIGAERYPVRLACARLADWSITRLSIVKKAWD